MMLGEAPTTEYCTHGPVKRAVGRSLWFAAVQVSCEIQAVRSHVTSRNPVVGTLETLGRTQLESFECQISYNSAEQQAARTQSPCNMMFVFVNYHLVTS
jgi:hypothetical protein